MIPIDGSRKLRRRRRKRRCDQLNHFSQETQDISYADNFINQLTLATEYPEEPYQKRHERVKRHLGWTEARANSGARQVGVALLTLLHLATYVLVHSGSSQLDSTMSSSKRSARPESGQPRHWNDYDEWSRLSGLPEASQSISGSRIEVEKLDFASSRGRVAKQPSISKDIHRSNMMDNFRMPAANKVKSISIGSHDIKQVARGETRSIDMRLNERFYRLSLDTLASDSHADMMANLKADHDRDRSFIEPDQPTSKANFATQSSLEERRDGVKSVPDLEASGVGLLKLDESSHSIIGKAPKLVNTNRINVSGVVEPPMATDYNSTQLKDQQISSQRNFYAEMADQKQPSGSPDSELEAATEASTPTTSTQSRRVVSRDEHHHRLQPADKRSNSKPLDLARLNWWPSEMAIEVPKKVRANSWAKRRIVAAAGLLDPDELDLFLADESLPSELFSVSQRSDNDDSGNEPGNKPTSKIESTFSRRRQLAREASKWFDIGSSPSQAFETGSEGSQEERGDDEVSSSDNIVHDGDKNKLATIYFAGFFPWLTDEVYGPDRGHMNSSHHFGVPRLEPSQSENLASSGELVDESRMAAAINGGQISQLRRAKQKQSAKLRAQDYMPPREYSTNATTSYNEPSKYKQEEPLGSKGPANGNFLRSSTTIARHNNYGQLGRIILPAVRLALDHINNNNSILSSYRLEIVPRDTQVSSIELSFLLILDQFRLIKS